jgi:hypothetical protein
MAWFPLDLVASPGRDVTVTHVVYAHEIADARRRHMRRSRITAEFAGALRVVLATGFSVGRRAHLAPARLCGRL